MHLLTLSAVLITCSVVAGEVWQPALVPPSTPGLEAADEPGWWLFSSDRTGWHELTLPGSGFAFAGWHELHIKLANPGVRPVELHVLLDGVGTDDVETGFRLRLPAGWSGTACLPVEHLRFSYSGWAWPEPYAPLVESGWGRLPSGQVKAVRVSLTAPSAIHIGAVALSGPLPASGWVDAWGQRAAGDWPGKVRSDADLTAANAAESAWLAAQPPIPGRDAWQAWSDGPQLGERRFFGLAQHGGRWWLVAPSGRPFLSTGLCVVIPGLHGPVHETAVREAHTWIPPRDGPFADTWKGDEVSLGSANLRRTWGDAWAARHLDRAVARIHAWGFTSLGNWCDSQVIRASGKPWVNVGPNHWWPLVEPMRVPTISPNIHDVFHPDFPAEASRQATSSCAPHADDQFLIGHFIHNEVSWNRFAAGLLAAPVDQPARQAFHRLLAERYADDAKLSAAWNQPGASAATLRWTWTSEAVAPPMVQADIAAFRADVADRWYGGWAAAIRAADPNHLVLGSRLHADERHPEVIRACARHCDVLSINVYHQMPDAGEFARLYALSGRPILIGEYGHYSFDNGLLTAAVPVPDQQARGVAFRRFTEAALALPMVIGAHAFQYWDEPITGRFDTETSANGFIAVTGIPWPHLRDAARATAMRIYAVASGQEPPWAGE